MINAMREGQVYFITNQDRVPSRKAHKGIEAIKPHTSSHSIAHKTNVRRDFDSFIKKPDRKLHHNNSYPEITNPKVVKIIS